MNTTKMKRLAQAVLVAGLALPMSSLLPAATPFSTSTAQALPLAAKAEATTLAEFKAILANYGTFGTHEKYGEIWVPTVTPQGWHPYPACQWSYVKDIGWYFNDNTPWGAIVHHYGRWSHDEKIGWFWVPDEDWSPGWVAWRKSEKWIGWAPLPPEQDIQLVSSEEFNNDKLWIFVEAQKFLKGDCGNTVQASQVFNLTEYVTLFDMPAGLLVDIIVLPHWKVKVITKLVTIFIDRICPPENPPRRNPNTPIPLRHTDAPSRPVFQGSTPVHLVDPGPKTPHIVIDLPPRRTVGKPGRSRGQTSEQKSPRRPKLTVMTPTFKRPNLVVRNPNLVVHTPALKTVRGSMSTIMTNGRGRNNLR